MDQSKAFIAQESGLIFYNQKAIINIAFLFFYNDIDSDVQVIFDFPEYVSAYLRVYDERMGQLLKDYSAQLVRNSNAIIMNSSVADMTFENLGPSYFYELGYNRSGYETPLRYGKLTIV